MSMSNICVERAFQNKIKAKGLLRRHFKKLLTLTVSKFYRRYIDDIFLMFDKKRSC